MKLNLTDSDSVGIRKFMLSTTSHSGTPEPWMPATGLNADGHSTKPPQLPVLKNHSKVTQDSMPSLATPNSQFATPLKLLSTLNLATSAPSSVSNGPISLSARPETSPSLNKVCGTTSVTSVSSLKPPSLPSSAKSHHLTLPSKPDKLPSHISLLHHSPSSLASSSMMSLERSSLETV